MTVIVFIIILAVLIFVHEFGHFIFARMNGIRVDAFKLGFGPKIIAWKHGETEYGINLIPFGGFVKIHGENPDDDSISGPDAARSFVHKNRWKQASVLFAGVFFNFLFAWIIYIIIFSVGVNAPPDEYPQYADRFQDQRIMLIEVSAGSPAAKAGLAIGDSIAELKTASAEPGSPTKTISATDGSLTVENIQKLVSESGGTPVAVTFERGGMASTTNIIPVKGIVAGTYAIGIAMSDAVTFHLPFLSAVKEGTIYTVVMIRDTAVGLATFVANIFQGTAQWSQVTGPVGIARDLGDVIQLGFVSVLMFTALISVNLGIINLIPFPALDGGRILFVAIEGETRRRISPNFTNIVNLIGFVLLMILMVAVTYKDIFN